MLTLLMYVIILGVIAWVINTIPMQAMFKNIAYAILIIILVVILFNAIGVSGIPLR